MRVNGNGSNAKFRCATKHTSRDFASISYQKFLNHHNRLTAKQVVRRNNGRVTNLTGIGRRADGVPAGGKRALTERPGC